MLITCFYSKVFIFSDGKIESQKGWLKFSVLGLFRISKWVLLLNIGRLSETFFVEDLKLISMVPQFCDIFPLKMLYLLVLKQFIVKYYN